jgi:hypothetical protein
MLACMKLPIALALLAIAAPLASAQSGHWEGAISAGNEQVKIQVDLLQDEKMVWTGAITIPDQNVRAFPLSDVAVAGGAVKFAMKGIPGDPAFDGKVAQDGKSISGNFHQGGQTAAFQMTRTGEAKIEKAEKSTPLAKEFEGTWEGLLATGGPSLRLVLNLANGPDGLATGTLTSVDQGGAVIPIATIVQKGSTWRLVLPTIGATYVGEVNKEGTRVAGQWTQGAGTLGLVFRRPAPAK